MTATKIKFSDNDIDNHISVIWHRLLMIYNEAYFRNYREHYTSLPAERETCFHDWQGLIKKRFHDGR